jgi:HAE1 family hydrophobic/amphiphilic exporter-1
MGAVPISLSLGAGSISRRPLGYAIVGGVFFSTALTLFLVPVVYSLLDTLLVRLAGTRPASPPHAVRPVEAE